MPIIRIPSSLRKGALWLGRQHMEPPNICAAVGPRHCRDGGDNLVWVQKGARVKD